MFSREITDAFPDSTNEVNIVVFSRTLLDAKFCEGEEEEVDRRRGGKTTSKTGQGWSSPPPRGLWRDGEIWLQRRHWGPSDPYGLRDK